MEGVKIVSDQPALSSEKLHQLFNEAVTLTASAPAPMDGTFHDAIPDARRGIEAILRAQHLLKLEIHDRIQDAIRLAAARGYASADVFVFHGADRFRPAQADPPLVDTFPILFLLKGPVDKEQREKLAGEGFKPLLHTLQEELYPFQVHHRWTAGSGENKLIVAWPRSYNISA